MSIIIAAMMLWLSALQFENNVRATKMTKKKKDLKQHTEQWSETGVLNLVYLRGKNPILAKTGLTLVYLSGSSGAILYRNVWGHHAWIISQEQERVNTIWYTGAQAKWIRFN